MFVLIVKSNFMTNSKHKSSEKKIIIKKSTTTAAAATQLRLALSRTAELLAPFVVPALNYFKQQQ